MTVECIGPRCTARAVQPHHVVYQQELRRAGGDPKDERGTIACCVRCHTRHHQRIAPFPLWVLPDAAFEFAAEVLGPLSAHVYLERRYAGGDPRLDALLDVAA